jgi:hypothetical protein
MEAELQQIHLLAAPFKLTTPSSFTHPGSTSNQGDDGTIFRLAIYVQVQFLLQIVLISPRLSSRRYFFLTFSGVGAARIAAVGRVAQERLDHLISSMPGIFEGLDQNQLPDAWQKYACAAAILFVRLKNTMLQIERESMYFRFSGCPNSRHLSEHRIFCLLSYPQRRNGRRAVQTQSSSSEIYSIGVGVHHLLGRCSEP